MDQADEEVMDIEQARLIISLKNDEINNLRSSIKANEIRNSLKMADFQYKIQHSQNKTSMVENKLVKGEESLKKQKEKFEEQLSKLHSENQKLRQTLEQTLSLGRQKQRELKGELYDERMKLQKEKEQNYKWNCEFQAITKYFDPKKVLTMLDKEKLEDIPSYVELYKKHIDAQEIIKHSNLQLSTMRSQIMSQMEESFQKLSSYESVMWDLKQKNEQLRVQVEQKENQLQLRSEEINERKSLLEAVEEQANSQIEHLSEELITLRNQYDTYHREDERGKIKRTRSDSFYMQKIQQIEHRFWAKQAENSHILIEYEEKLLKLQEENRLLKTELQEMQLKLTQAEQQQLISAINYERELQDKKKFIALLEVSVKDQEEFNEELKRENQKLLKDLKDILMQKHKLVQECKMLEQEYKSQVSSLSQQLNQLRAQLTQNQSDRDSQSSSNHRQLKQLSQYSGSQRQLKVLKRMKSGEGSIYNLGSSRNLLLDLNEKFQLEVNGEELRSNADIGQYEQDPTWPEKYYALLQKHNLFIKQVFGRLKSLKESQT